MQTTIIPSRLALALLLFATTRTTAGPQESADIEFFEKRIRPVFVENCYECHSAKLQQPKGGLRLDTRAGLLKGGDSGPALVPGKPSESLLLKAVGHTSPDLKMPPKGKLSAAVLADLEQWIARGAPDPRGDRAEIAKGIDFEAAKKHWAYQPIRRPSIPIVKQKEWPISPIDYFILEKLEASRLTPSPPADRRTLLRRVYFDLIGLPPTFAEVEAFVNDNSPDAFAKVVERLLASPRYGERWGRHWLDVARFADTKDGVLMYGGARIRPYAYTYRDYVVRAFNEDVPYDRFIHEQLAADLIEPKVEPWRLAAMGFLTLGRMFDNNVHDVLDDRIDTVTRGLLGLTVSCARCHDHKYDAIPTADYYSLYGVFASSEAPIELPLIADPDTWPGFEEFEEQARPKREELQKFLDDQHDVLTETARKRAGAYLIHIATKPPDPLETAVYFLSLAPEDLRPQIVNRWRRLLEQRSRPDDAVFGPWHDLMHLADKNFPGKAPRVIGDWLERSAGTTAGQLNPLVREALAVAKLTSRADLAKTYGSLLERAYTESKKGVTDAPLADARRQLMQILTGQDAPSYFPKSLTFHYMSRREKDSFAGKLVELDILAVKFRNAPPRAMTLHDAPERYEPRVFIRGNAATPGDPVPRQFLRVLSGAERKPFLNGSGRLDLARAITAPDNPLTARVLVNRVWMHHFGEPLVATPSDFGTRSNPPSHPELLDYLAFTFRTRGWSLKDLHRLILTSATYQQASFDRPACRKVDPENRLLWRMHRRRLDLETMRDSLLFVSGRLDPRMFGRPVDVANDAKNRRRTVYGLVDRQSLPGLYRAFDFASPDQSAERRPSTTVPQQALFAMNSAFMLEQVTSLMARPEIDGETDRERRITAMYRVILARAPTQFEVNAGRRFLTELAASKDGADRSALTRWEQYAQVLLLTNESVFVD